MTRLNRLAALNFFKTSTGYLASTLLLLAMTASAVLGVLVLARLGQIVFAQPQQAGSPPLQGAAKWDEIRNSLLVIGTSLGVPFIVWRTLLLARQTQMQQDGQHSEIFFKAITLLGEDRAGQDERGEAGGSHPKPNLEARVGAIYAISRVSSVSAFYHWPTVETLLAYVKLNGDEPRDYLSTEDRSALDSLRKRGDLGAYLALHRSKEADIPRFVRTLSYPREDIQAALNVVAGREGRAAAEVSRQLRRMDFRRACLHRAGLRNAMLRNARLQMVHALGADFRNADLRGADLYLSRLDGSYLEEASLAGANLCGAVLSAADIGIDVARFCRQLNTAFGDAWTVLPAGIEPPAHWLKGDHDWQEIYAGWTDWRRQRRLPLVQVVN